MELQSIFNFMCDSLLEGCKKSLAHNNFELFVYLAFCFFNIMRVFTYIPTIKKLMQPGCTGDGQSLLTWITWICANATLGLHLYVIAGYHVNDVVWLSVGNVIMCTICAVLVFKVQKRSKMVEQYLEANANRATIRSTPRSTNQANTQANTSRPPQPMY
jgi:fatty acid desaturase